MSTLRHAVSGRTSPRGLAIIALSVAAAVGALAAGCGKPSAANIALRKENAELRAQVETLERRHDAAVASLRAREAGATTVPTLPQAQLARLFTVHGIQFGRLTGPADLDRSTPGEEGLKVYVTPTDGAAQQLKAAGSFVIEAFDLAKGDDVRIGRWVFPLEDAARNWFGQALLYGYVLPCPWQERPGHSEVTLKVTFTDALTGRSFTRQTIVQVTPAPPTPPIPPAPATRPATRPPAKSDIGS